MQAIASLRVPVTPMTLCSACHFSSASGNWSISTGKERDTESGNDYFGARYYSSAMGRWLGPNWSAKEDPVSYAKLDNPQTLNLYAYLVDNPLRSTDPDGHGDQDDYAAKIAAQAKIEDGSNHWDSKNIDVSNGQVFWSGSNKCNEL
jgi:RHS repeat-associated protein